MKYILKESWRARNLRITVKSDGSVVLTKPVFISIKRAKKFLENKLIWIEKSLKSFHSDEPVLQVKNKRQDYLNKKERARSLIEDRLRYFSIKHNFKYQKVKIKNQKTVWGSCSQKGNLNFNYKLIYLSKEIVDYVIVHELCHLKELNHSKKYWKLVIEIMPDYKKYRTELKNTKIT